MVGVKLLFLGPTYRNFDITALGSNLASGVLKSPQFEYLAKVENCWFLLKPTLVTPGDMCSKLVHHHHFTLGAFYSWGEGVGLGLEDSVQMGRMS